MFAHNTTKSRFQEKLQVVRHLQSTLSLRGGFQFQRDVALLVAATRRSTYMSQLRASTYSCKSNRFLYLTKLEFGFTYPFVNICIGCFTDNFQSQYSTIFTNKNNVSKYIV